MATKIKKSYDLTAKDRKDGRITQEEKEARALDKRDAPIIFGEEVVSAPLWRRIIAYLIDFCACFGGTAIMISAALGENVTTLSRLIYLFSAIMLQLLLFGITPTDYWPGQTLGRKAMGIYLRRLDDKKSLGTMKNFLRDYIYSMLAFILTIPAETVFLLIQLMTKTFEDADNLQSVKIGQHHFILPRDRYFKVEAVYLPKKAKDDTATA